MALLAPPPVPVADAQRRLNLRAVPVYWHLLSLDAPTLAVLWASALGRAARVRPAPSALAVLGIGAWLLYVGDRLLDGRPSVRHPHLRERHFFHARHRRALLAAGAVAVPLLLWLIFAVMPSAARRDDTVIFVVAMVYFAIVHLRAPRTRRGYPRELTVSLVFAAATAAPAWSQSSAAHPALPGPALLFAALCCVNCIAIEHWERPAPDRRFSLISVMAAGVIAASGALLLHAVLADSAELPLALAALASALLLLLLDQHRLFAHRSPGMLPMPSQLAMRIAADAALLTPLLLLLPRPR